MKRKISLVFASVTAISSLLAFSSCSDDFSSYRYVSDVSDRHFNTPTNIIVYYDSKIEGEEDKAKEVVSSVHSYIDGVEKALSVALTDGDVYAFNEAQPGESIQIGKTTYDVLNECIDLYNETDGAYNPAVSMLVDLWGFSPRFDNGSSDYEIVEKYDRAEYWSNLPSFEYVDAFRQLTSFGKVTTLEENGKYTVTKPQDSVTVDGVTYSMKIDLGGFGKGYAADGATKIIRDAGFEYGYLSIGGSSVDLLKCPSSDSGSGKAGDWSVKFTYPTKTGSFMGAWYGEVFDRDIGVSTSGNYEQYYVFNDVQYCHIIDASTGCPIQTGIASASICGGTAAANDALTTALCVMGTDKAIEFINAHLTDKQVMFAVTNDEKQRYDIYTNVPKEKFNFNEAYSSVLYAKGVGDGTGKIKVE